MDAEAGGAADLQTDVMRFMAILSLCLVAIFALVQSIPIAPTPEAPPPVKQAVEIETVATPTEQSTSPKREVTAATEIRLTRPAAQKLPPREKQPMLQRPAAPAAHAAAIPEAPPPAPAASKVGFTLRFEDDVALARLVARNEVGLYAIFPDSSFRLQVDRGQMNFRAASSPEQFHEMDASTVPQPVIDAFQRGNNRHDQGTQWGVTIPSSTTRQLDQYLRDSSGGELIIDADGDLRLEP